MDQTIISCPVEVLYDILSYLSPFEVESVVKTFSKPLFDVAYPIFLRHKAWLENARRMTSLFKPKESENFLPSFPGYLPVLEPQWSTSTIEIPGRGHTLESLGLGSGDCEFVATSPPDLRSWMQLDGSFGWLKPLTGKAKAIWEMDSGPPGERAAGKAQVILHVMEMAKKLGLVLPDGFETFMKSKELHYRIPSSLAWYFELHPIAKPPEALDGGEGGYVLKFHIDQQSCAFAYLYLHPSGGHCVLISSEDWCE